MSTFDAVAAAAATSAAVAAVVAVVTAAVFNTPAASMPLLLPLLLLCFYCYCYYRQIFSQMNYRKGLLGDKPVNESYNPKRMHHQLLLFRADLSSQHSWHRFEIKKEIEKNRLIEWSELFVFRLFSKHLGDLF